MGFSSHLFIFYFLPLVLVLNYVLPFRLLTLMLVTLSYVCSTAGVATGERRIAFEMSR